jgi:DNA-directed RNA polymerase subunit RPC12/RpoP
MAPSIENQKGTTSLVSKIENCLDCGSPLPSVPAHSLRRPDDHCPSCGMRLPDIGLCYQPGFDHCLNCGATQPALLPGGERPRPHCHKCGERLHNPEPT